VERATEGGTAGGHSIWRWRNFWMGIVLLVAGFTGYSIYMGYWYSPDPQNTVLLGQSALYADSPAAVRVLITDQRTGKPLKGAKVRITIKGNGGAADLGSFTTDNEGTSSDQLQVPALPPGKYSLTVQARSGVGKDTIVRDVEIKRPVRLYLSTDKPIYQPGQALHMRAMVLNKATLRPFSGEQIDRARCPACCAASASACLQRVYRCCPLS